MANIHLTVTIPDPGEWCLCPGKPNVYGPPTDAGKTCRLLSEDTYSRWCALGFPAVSGEPWSGIRRPPECHAAQRKEET